MFYKRLLSYLFFYHQYYRRQKIDSQYQPLSKVLELYGRNGLSPEVLLFGDSVSERISKFDEDTRTLHQMIIDNIKSYHKIGSISYSAYNIDIYYLFTLIIQVLNRKPKILVLPINMRSFSPQWDLNPMFQCYNHIADIKNFINKCNYRNEKLTTVGEKITIARYFKIKFQSPVHSYNSIGSFIDIIYSKPKTKKEQFFRYKQIFIYHYLYRLEKNHRKLLHLEKLIELTQRMGINIFIYLTPINYKAGLRFVGEEFIDVFKTNIQVIKEFIANNKWCSKKIILSDFSMTLDPKYFFSEHESTEHLNENGRRVLAQNIVSGINSFQRESNE